MKITMKNSEEKGVSNSSSTTGSGSANSQNSSNSKIRIAVFGQHDVGKSALTVRYLTRRYIGEYKSNTDLIYRQTLSVNHGMGVDVEIVDHFDKFDQADFDAYIIVYSITDRSSFTFALEALSDIYNCYNNLPSSSPSSSNGSISSNSNSTSPNASPQPKATCPVALIANKNDLEHLRNVDKIEGISASMQYGCQFYELSVAENSPEVYQSFQTIINTLMAQNQHCQQPSKSRKFSVSKMLGNLRLGRTSPSNTIVTSQASMVDTNDITNSPRKSCNNITSNNNDENKSATESPFSSPINEKCHQRHSSQSDSSCSSSSSSSSCSSTSSNNSSCNNLSSSICHLKSKLVELHSMKKRHNSPPICSL